MGRQVQIPTPLPADVNENARNSIELTFQKQSKHLNQTVDEEKCTDPDPNLDPSENMLEQDMEMAGILLSLLREAPFDVLKSTNSYLTNEMPEYMGSISIMKADQIVTVDQATQTQSVEELLRQNWVDQILEHLMYYTGLKSKEVLKYLSETVQDKADMMSLW